MRKIVNMFRSRNHTVVYFVIRDGEKCTMEVWQCSTDTNDLSHCHSWNFTVAVGGWTDRKSVV